MPECHHLRLTFEARRLREAFCLASQLRAEGSDTVRVRPARRQRHGWTVTAITPPAVPTPAVIERWESTMREVAARCQGTRFVGSRAFLALDEHWS